MTDLPLYKHRGIRPPESSQSTCASFGGNGILVRLAPSVVRR